MKCKLPSGLGLRVEIDSRKYRHAPLVHTQLFLLEIGHHQADLIPENGII